MVLCRAISDRFEILITIMQTLASNLVSLLNKWFKVYSFQLQISYRNCFPRTPLSSFSLSGSLSVICCNQYKDHPQLYMHGLIIETSINQDILDKYWSNKGAILDDIKSCYTALVNLTNKKQFKMKFDIKIIY